MYDVVLLSETWLSEDFGLNEVQVKNYEIFRTDRDPSVLGRYRGGGVLIAVSNKLKSRRVTVGSVLSSFDNVFVLVKISNVSLLLGCVYIPPNSDVETYLEHCRVVEELSLRFPDSSLFLTGDYNLRDATWSVDVEDSSMIVDCNFSYPAVRVCESFNSLSLQQVNSVPNDHGVFLDLLFTNEELVSTTPPLDPLLPNNFHHNAFCFDIVVPCQTDQLSEDKYIYDFSKCNVFELRKFLSSVDWSFLSSEKNVEVSTKRLYDFLQAGIELSTPVKRVYSSTFPVWFTNELKSLIFKKKRAHSLYKKSRLESDYRCFSSLRSRCNHLSSKCYRDFLERSDKSLQRNPRSFWKFVNMTRKTDGFPKDMFFNDETSSTGQETADLFSKSFSKAYELSDRSVPEYPILDCIDFNGCSFSPTDVLSALSSLPQKFSSGPDNVPPFILQKCAGCLAAPLSVLFNKSLSSGVFPSPWKSSFIFPIHKSGDRSNIANYRGVCIQSSIPKVLDKLVSSRLSFACKQFISEKQHGFTTKRSTVTNLLCYQSDILNSFESGQDVHSVYTDVAKAFDRVNPRFLVAKLKSYGIGDAFLRWLANSFSDRIQMVRIGDDKSSSIVVSSGVGQGSHSGPLLFSLFFNDLPSVIQYSCLQMFADDVKIYKSISSHDDCRFLQKDLDSFHRWLSTNNLQLTHSKCAIMCFSRRVEPVCFDYHLDLKILNNVEKIKDLGVELDCKLSFIPHISAVSMRCHRLLGYIFRSSRGLSSVSFRLLYISLVRSLLEYACVVWSPYYNVHELLLERVQKKFLHYYIYRYPNSSASLDSLKQRRHQADSRFLQKLISGDVDCSGLLGLIPFDCHRRLRRANTFYLTSCGSNYMHYAPLNRMLRSANTNCSFDF